MQIHLLGDVRSGTIARLPNWNRIQSYIPAPVPSRLFEFVQSHESTRSKLSFAEYHLRNLDSLYAPAGDRNPSDIPEWALTEVNSVVLSLCSALDSAAYEVSLAYSLGVGPTKSRIHHDHVRFTAECVRCHLSSMGDPLNSYLETELSLSWFATLNRLRSLMTCKTLPAIKVGMEDQGSPGGLGRALRLTLPNDPANTNPGTTDYSGGTEANRFCSDAVDHARSTVDGIYPLIETKVRRVYSV